MMTIYGKAQRRRQGTVLIVTMFIVFTLAALVLVLGRRVRVDGLTAANQVAAVQAASIERGAEQYVLAILTEEKDTLPDLGEEYFGGVQVGDGYFWILRPQYGDDNLPRFGLTEEGGKLNINNASYDSLMKLPNMTDDVANAIIDWRDDNTEVKGSGAESEYYMTLPSPYMAKNAPYETVEEMLLVRGVTRPLLYGDGTAPPLGEYSSVRSSGGAQSTDLQTARGWYDLLTIYSIEPASAGASSTGTGTGSTGSGSTGATGGGGKININQQDQRQQLQQFLQDTLGQDRATAIIGSMGGGRNPTTYDSVFDFYVRTKQSAKLTPEEFDQIFPRLSTETQAAGGAAGTGTKGRIDVNVAPRDVLLTLPGLEAADVDKVISAREGATTTGGIAWFADTLDAEKAKSKDLEKAVTSHTYQYSADILAVTGNGRAFKRVRIVVDTSGSTPQIKYRRDLTDRGWPMATELLDSLRAGQGPGGWAAAGGGSTPGGMIR